MTFSVDCCKLIIFWVSVGPGAVRQACTQCNYLFNLHSLCTMYSFSHKLLFTIHDSEVCFNIQRSLFAWMIIQYSLLNIKHAWFEVFDLLSTNCKSVFANYYILLVSHYSRINHDYLWYIDYNAWYIVYSWLTICSISLVLAMWFQRLQRGHQMSPWW